MRARLPALGLATACPPHRCIRGDGIGTTRRGDRRARCGTGARRSTRSWSRTDSRARPRGASRGRAARVAERHGRSPSRDMRRRRASRRASRSGSACTRHPPARRAMASTGSAGTRASAAARWRAAPSRPHGNPRARPRCRSGSSRARGTTPSRSRPEADWTSGVYVVVLTRGTVQSYASFVVRDDAQDRRARAPAVDAHEPGVQQLPEQRDDRQEPLCRSTRSALITLNGYTSAVKASFDRPYAELGRGGRDDLRRADGALRRVARLRRHVRDRHGPARRPRAPHRPGGAALGRPRRVLDERDVQRGRAGARRGCRPRVPRRERRLLAGAAGAVGNRSARSGDGCLPRGEPRSRHGRLRGPCASGISRDPSSRSSGRCGRRTTTPARRAATIHGWCGRRITGSTAAPASATVEDPAARGHRGRPAPAGVPRPGAQGGHDPGRARRLDVRHAHREQHRAAGVHARSRRRRTPGSSAPAPCATRADCSAKDPRRSRPCAR